jgi:hypothetical protein
VIALASRYPRRPSLTRDQAVAIALVLEAVHPGNLGPLPPSPQHLLWKAHQIGLLSSGEWLIR